VNDPSRTQDLEDIRQLLRMNRDTLDLDEVKSYFSLFEREPLLDGYSDMNSAERTPLAADGGLKPPAAPIEDPFEALDDLMVVIEALCPTWPPPPTFRDGGRMLL